MTEHRTCARGCTVARRHLAACEDRDACRGCEPRKAEEGFLCYGCQRRLVNLLEVAPGQIVLLNAMAGLQGEVELTALTTAKPPLRWRVNSDEVLRTLYANPGMGSFAQSEPYRVAVLDSVRAIEDRLSLWVMNLVNDYVLTDPEPNPTDCAAFLTRHLERLVWRLAIGDELEQFMETMSQAHSLAPWREQVARLHGIPCPECHTTTLVMFGGDSDVTCLRCKATMDQRRYGIWTRMLADEHREETG